MVSNINCFINKSEFWKKRVGVDLTRISSEESINQVIAVMRDTDDMDEVREHAGASLGRIGTDYTIDILEHDLKNSDDPKLRLFCMVGLRVSTHHRVNEILLERLADEDEDGSIRNAACYNLACRQCDAVIPHAIQYINEPFMSKNTFLDSNLAVESLLKFKTPEAMNAIIEWSMMAVVDESRPDLQREHAASYLRQYGDKRCEALMVDMIDHPIVCSQRLHAGKSRNHAVETLKRLNTPNAQAAIQAWEHRQQSTD